MKKQRVGAIVLAGVMLLNMAGCGKDSKTKAYSKYVTLGDYKGIEYTRTVEEVTDENVQSQIDTFLNGLKETEDITDRAVQEGDIVNIDYVGTKDGEAFDGGSAQGYDLTIGSNSFIDGFESGLIGHNIGEQVSLDLTFPENYSSEELAGQAVNFAVTINSIAVEHIPELTDELVKENTEYDTVDAYKDSIRKDLHEQNETYADNQAKQDIFDKVMENATISGYEESEVKENVDKQFESFKQTAEQYANYGYSYEDVMMQYGYNSEDALKEGLTEYVKESLGQKMVLYSIADNEGIKVDDSEVEEKVQEYMDQYGVKTKEEIYDYFGEENFKLSILSEKVMDFLMENGVEVESTESEETNDDTSDAATEAETTEDVTEAETTEE